MYAEPYQATTTSHAHHHDPNGPSSPLSASAAESTRAAHELASLGAPPSLDSGEIMRLFQDPIVVQGLANRDAPGERATGGNLSELIGTCAVFFPLSQLDDRSLQCIE